MATEPRGLRRRLTETKNALKTTEFWAYVTVLIALLIAGAVTTGDEETGEADLLPADDVWLFATILTVGYMLSRGLAKSGSEEPYTPDEGGGGGPGVGDRVRAAAEAARQP